MRERTKDYLFLAVLGLGYLLVGGLALSSCSQAKGQDAWAPYRAVCEIRVNQGRFRSWTGSGTLIARKGDMGLLLSCRHVNTKKGMAVKVVWHGSKGQEVTGYVADVLPGKTPDWDTDIALVYAPVPPSIQPVPVASFSDSNGVWRSVGYRGGQFYECVANQARAYGSQIQLHCVFIGGMSGGACFDRFGRLVGVVVASDGYSVGICSDGENLKSLLKRYGW